MFAQSLGHQTTAFRSFLLVLLFAYRIRALIKYHNKDLDLWLCKDSFLVCCKLAIFRVFVPKNNSQVFLAEWCRQQWRGRENCSCQISAYHAAAKRLQVIRQRIKERHKKTLFVSQFCGLVVSFRCAVRVGRLTPAVWLFVFIYVLAAGAAECQISPVCRVVLLCNFPFEKQSATHTHKHTPPLFHSQSSSQFLW